MTDNEIMKGLELSIKYELKTSCEDCIAKCESYCKWKLLTNTLDLINRLKKENDDLFYKLEGVMHSVDKWLEGDELKQDEVNRAITMREKTLQITEKQQAEIKRLNKEANKEANKEQLRRQMYRSTVEEIKSEAIKEFAERLKEKATSTFYEEHKYIDTEDVDNLVKEMTEGVVK